MYLAVLIARLVGLHIAHSQKRTLTEKFTGVVPPNSIYLFVVTWGCYGLFALRDLGVLDGERTGFVGARIGCGACARIRGGYTR